MDSTYLEDFQLSVSAGKLRDLACRLKKNRAGDGYRHSGKWPDMQVEKNGSNCSVSTSHLLRHRRRALAGAWNKNSIAKEMRMKT